MNTLTATENVDFLSTNFAAILLCYILLGAVLFVLIRLNRNTYKSLETFLADSEKEKARKEEHSSLLHQELLIVTESLGKINGQIQTHLSSQTEMKIAVNRISSGSQVQTQQISQISEMQKSRDKGWTKCPRCPCCFLIIPCRLPRLLKTARIKLGNCRET